MALPVAPRLKLGDRIDGLSVTALIADVPLQVAALLILFARIGAVWMLLPMFGEDSVSGPVRLLMALGMSLALLGLLGPRVTPFAAQDSALVANLAPGAYTAIVAGRNGTTGVGVVEAYHMQ